MGDASVSMGSFEGVHESARGFMSAADRMQGRLEELMHKVNSMNWTSEGRDAFDGIQRRFNTAYLDLKKILWELGSKVDGIATNQQALEDYLKRRVWVPQR
jgi:uncharacterized protein YukE